MSPALFKQNSLEYAVTYTFPFGPMTGASQLQEDSEKSKYQSNVPDEKNDKKAKIIQTLQFCANNAPVESITALLTLQPEQISRE
jgi:hypothetical protein